MGPEQHGVSTISGKWPVADIVYVSIVGTVMLAACLEWFLWLAAFLYCLIKVYQKAENWTIRVLAVIMMILFIALRCIFLPIMLVTLPLPQQVTQYFPPAMVSFLQWFAFWAFAGLLTIPWLFCVYQLVTNSLGRKKRIKTVLDEHSAPKVVIVMPCYKEIPDVLVTAVDSVVDCDYPPSCLHVFLSFDGEQEDELYLQTIERLGVPLSLATYPRSIDVTYRGTRITVSRFPHGGKRHCQKRTYKLIDKIYTEYLKRNDNLFILFIDSDCILDKVCIQNFMYEMELKPGSKHTMLAMTGVITSTTEKNSLITLLQDMEYIHGQLFERSVESGCGSVTCLPGALTILRFSAFRKMAKYYFADKAEQCNDLFDYGKCHLGEDRWLTHLFMIGAKERFQIQMCTGAFCKTEAVQTYKSLLKQRRRWFLGFITNEVCMLTDIRLWRRYPALLVVRFAQNTIRTTALLFFIMVISLITTSNKVTNLPVGFIAVSLGLNWLLMFYFGIKLGRYKAFLYPLMFVINPFFNWVYMVYGICTAGQRTWGGPRADAGAADKTTSVQQAILTAEATGDDLNVVPETFGPALQAGNIKNSGRPFPLPLQPSDRIDGRFVQAERLPGGWYDQGNSSLGTLPDVIPRNLQTPHIPLHPRASFDSFTTNTSSANNSIYLPRRVESIMDEDDRKKYTIAQAGQREAGGAYMTQPRGQMYAEVPEREYNGRAWNASLESFDSEQSHSKQQQNPRPILSRADSHRSSKSLPKSPIILPLSPMLAANLDPPTIPNIGSAIPESAFLPNERNSTTSRNTTRAGRSPLARLSLVRTAGVDDETYELHQQEVLDGFHGGRMTSLETDTLPNPRNSQDLQERRQRNRLSKLPKTSKDRRRSS
ncbi:MAG: hypothetical protein M1829_005494 [Trizodia sp. TS-e1964]|nr:MAG: hypothetical protein M1829_005494 [Trizodia sp. TS-e1964]